MSLCLQAYSCLPGPCGWLSYHILSFEMVVIGMVNLLRLMPWPYRIVRLCVIPLENLDLRRGWSSALLDCFLHLSLLRWNQAVDLRLKFSWTHLHSTSSKWTSLKLCLVSFVWFYHPIHKALAGEQISCSCASRGKRAQSVSNHWVLFK